jgi:hypothetical protein
MASEGKLNSVSHKEAVKRATTSRWQRTRFFVRKIISGGQSGVDQAVLDFAVERDISHGGYWFFPPFAAHLANTERK